MTIKLTVILTNNSGGVLDRTEIESKPGDVDAAGYVQARIHAVIADWSLAPGDTIEILGNEEAFDKL